MSNLVFQPFSDNSRDGLLAGASDAKHNLILIHGYGAGAADLAGLAEPLLAGAPGGLENFRVILPGGCLEIPLGWNPFENQPVTGRAWFPVDQRALELAQRSGTHRDFRKMTPEGLAAAVDYCRGLFRESETLSFLRQPGQRIWLGGFSQGAMLALELFFSAVLPPADVDGLFLFSANPMHLDQWRERAKDLTAPWYFFQSHGLHDPLLGFDYARGLFEFLESMGGRGDWNEFRGGHEIPPDTVGRAARFLRARLIKDS